MWGILPGIATACVPAALVISHLVIRNNRLAWSGYNASGDPAHHHALVVDVGCDFPITSEGKLYLNSPGPLQFAEISPTGFAVAAWSGMRGNQLDLYAAATGLSLVEAAVALCEQLHREVPWMLNGTPLRPRPANRYAPKSRSWRDPRKWSNGSRHNRSAGTRWAPKVVPSLIETDKRYSFGLAFSRAAASARTDSGSSLNRSRQPEQQTQ